MWEEISSEFWNGTLTGYRIMIFETKLGIAWAKFENASLAPNGSYSYEINGLEKFTNYTVQVAGFARALGSYSQPVTVTTAEDGKQHPLYILDNT